jgi:23S rRNA pseudouridine1911/1915/1917 synthase
MPLPPTIFEDEALLAFNKPADLSVTVDRSHPKKESLLKLIQARFGDDVVNVHRIDSEASGLFLCAKTKPAQDFVSGQFQAKTALKKFLALAAVRPVEPPANKLVAQARDASGALLDTFTVDAAIGEDDVNKGRMRVFKKQGGKDSVTEFRVLERFGRFAWIEARPVTGRPHQVRVHLAAVGAPILNDPLYGDPAIRLLLSNLKRGYKGREEEKPLVERLALHASEVAILHPVTREPLVLQAPLPDDLEIALKYLRKFADRKG